MEFSDKLKTLRIDKGYTQRTLGKMVGVSEVTIGNWERGVKQPSLGLLLALAEVFHTSVDSIVGKENIPAQDNLIFHSPAERRLLEKYRLLDSFGKKAVDTVCSIECERVSISQSKYNGNIIDFDTIKTSKRYIPLYSTPSAAGFSIPLEGDEFEMILADETVPENADFAVWIQGDSMEPYIKDGEMVFIDRDATLKNGDVGIFSVDGAMYCKQLYKDDHGNVYLLSANPDRQDANVFLSCDSGQSLQAYGKVVMDKIPLPDYFNK